MSATVIHNKKSGFSSFSGDIYSSHDESKNWYSDKIVNSCAVCNFILRPASFIHFACILINELALISILSSYILAKQKRHRQNDVFLIGFLLSG